MRCDSGWRDDYDIYQAAGQEKPFTVNLEQSMTDGFVRTRQRAMLPR